MPNNTEIDSIPTFALTNTTQATAYHFKCTNQLFGWAICTVNDRTGELLIQSDWGTWSYRWAVQHLGAPSLTAFLVGAEYEYIGRKLTVEGNSGRPREQFCSRTTVAAFRSELARERFRQGDSGQRNSRRDPLTKNEARRIWNELGELEGLDDASEFVDRFYEIKGHEWVYDSVGEELKYVPTTSYKALVDGILPALREVCRRTATERGEMDPRPDCNNPSPRGYTGHWRDWHRGHGCRLDPDATKTVEAVQAAVKSTGAPAPRLYVGAMNDALFIIDVPPRTDGTDAHNPNLPEPRVTIPIGHTEQDRVRGERLVGHWNAALDRELARTAESRVAS